MTGLNWLRIRLKREPWEIFNFPASMEFLHQLNEEDLISFS
jgi:hypothetical protein